MKTNAVQVQMSELREINKSTSEITGCACNHCYQPFPVEKCARYSATEFRKFRFFRDMKCGEVTKAKLTGQHECEM